jgi:hypothetical protein
MPLASAYKQAEANFSLNNDVRIAIADDIPTLSISNLDKLDDR